MNTPDTFEVGEARPADYEDLREGFQFDSDEPDDFATLRRYMDGDDQFMGAHQILKERRIQRQYPEWMANDSAVREFLSRRFPLLEKSREQRQLASRWAVIIRRYIVGNLSCLRVSEELNDGKPRSRHISNAYVRRTAQMIRQAAAGERLDGKPRSFGKPGRPRKSACTPRTAGSETYLTVASTT